MQPTRLGILRTIAEAIRRPVPPSFRTHHALAWVIALFFVIQGVSGILLSIYYQPTQDMAAESVRFIMRDVNWGWLMRGVHHWAAHGMILCGIVHILSVFFAGAYRGRGGAQWCVALLLLAIVVLFAYSGSLLTWDGQALTSARLALQRIDTLPLLGPWLVLLLRGGEELTAPTLNRAFAIHAQLLPAVFVLLFLLGRWLGSGRNEQGGAP